MIKLSLHLDLHHDRNLQPSASILVKVNLLMALPAVINAICGTWSFLAFARLTSTKNRLIPWGETFPRGPRKYTRWLMWILIMGSYNCYMLYKLHGITPYRPLKQVVNCSYATTLVSVVTFPLCASRTRSSLCAKSCGSQAKWNVGWHGPKRAKRSQRSEPYVETYFRWACHFARICIFGLAYLMASSMTVSPFLRFIPINVGSSKCMRLRHCDLSFLKHVHNR